MCEKCAETGIVGWNEKYKDWSDGAHTCYREAVWCDCAWGRKYWKDQKISILYEYGGWSLAEALSQEAI